MTQVIWYISFITVQQIRHQTVDYIEPYDGSTSRSKKLEDHVATSFHCLLHFL